MKKCCTCQIEKLSIEFNKNKSKKDGLNSICKECSRQRSRKYYSENREHHKKVIYGNKQSYVKELRHWINTVIRKDGCCCCEEKSTVCLEFHHIDQTKKEKLVSKLIGSNCRKKLIYELNKCAVVCSNCHRKIHAGLLPNPIDKQLKDVRLPE